MKEKEIKKRRMKRKKKKNFSKKERKKKREIYFQEINKNMLEKERIILQRK